MEQSTSYVALSDIETYTISGANLGHMPAHNVLAFGLPKDFNGLNLPTEQEVLQCFFYLFDQSKMINKMYSFKTFTPCVVDKLFLIWGKIDIPLINKLSIAKKLKTLIAKYKTESKNRTTYEAFVQSTKKMYFILQNVDVL